MIVEALIDILADLEYCIDTFDKVTIGEAERAVNRGYKAGMREALRITEQIERDKVYGKISTEEAMRQYKEVKKLAEESEDD